MKTSQISKWVSVFSFGILVSATVLVVFGAFSSSFLRGGFSGKSDEFRFVKRIPLKGPNFPPIFAYLISGSNGESNRILRLLKSVYHPRNCYLLNLDSGSSEYERKKLALSVQSEKTFQAYGNVDVIGRSHPVEKMGSSALASVLQGAAILLKINKDWDWFIALSPSDYPIMTQDDLLHAFTFLPRDLNFIHFNNNNTSWNQRQNINRIVTDPNLHLLQKTPISYSSETRVTPDAFKIFEGSPWMILTRAFMEYCVHGWDNLPRNLLMYFTNSVSPLESYFHTVICNSDDFQNTTINNNLRYVLWENHPEQEWKFLDLSHYKRIVQSEAVFARRFREGSPVLQKLDEDILNRLLHGLVPGKWCLNTTANQSTENTNSKLDNCSSWGNINTVKPGPRGLKLGNFLSKLAAGDGLRSSQCNSKEAVLV